MTASAAPAADATDAGTTALESHTRVDSPSLPACTLLQIPRTKRLRAQHAPPHLLQLPPSPC
eukprot:6182519-Pleurochrysis_carterae.AAC.3